MSLLSSETGIKSTGLHSKSYELTFQ